MRRRCVRAAATTAALAAVSLVLVLLGGGRAAVAASSPADASCSAAMQASVSLSKSQPTTFTIGHAHQQLDQQLALTYSGCTFATGGQPTVALLLPQASTNVPSLTWEDEGDGVAFIHLRLDASHLQDGTQIANLVINGPDVSTLVVPLTLIHQYKEFWLALIAAIAAWLVGLYIGSAHSVSGEANNPSIKAVGTVMLSHWFSLLLTAGAAYGTFMAAYESTDDFKGGYAGLISLGAKVGAATIGALAITVTAGNSSRAVARGIASRS